MPETWKPAADQPRHLINRAVNAGSADVHIVNLSASRRGWVL